MTSLPKILLTLGILMSAGGIAGAGFLYRDMKIETLKHARTGDITLSLAADTSSWKKGACTLFRSGSHAVILTLDGPRPNSGRVQAEYHGALDIEVSSPDGTVALRGTFRPAGVTLPLPDSGMSVVLGTFNVADPTEESWNVRVRVATPDSAFGTVGAELSILPPQIYEIGSYIAGRIYILLGLGIIGLGGFGIIVLAASMQQRARLSSAATKA